MTATDLLSLMRQRPSPPVSMPSAPLGNPQAQTRVPLRYGGHVIPVDHPLYDLIKRIILERYQGPQAPMGSQG